MSSLTAFCNNKYCKLWEVIYILIIIIPKKCFLPDELFFSNLFNIFLKSNLIQQPKNSKKFAKINLFTVVQRYEKWLFRFPQKCGVKKGRFFFALIFFHSFLL